MPEYKQINADQLVSILMPVRNGEMYLIDCLDSVLQQSYTNWELIVVNDHSSDATETILVEYAKKDSRIKTLNNIGRGIVPALQLAYQISNGNWITRMDADDVMAVKKIELLFESAAIGCITTGFVKYFSRNGVGDGYKKYEKWLNGLTEKESNFTEIYKECVIPSPCWMLHRTDLDRIEAFNSEVYPEDYDLTFRCYQYKLKVIGVKEVLHHWRDYENRSSRTDENYLDNRFLSLKLRYYLLLERNENIPLILLGAGKKAKELAQELIEKDLSFDWICNNPNKIGHNIYGVVLKGEDELNPTAQIIGAIAGDGQQQYAHNSNITWFC